jgi:hypothetical protein
MQLLIVVIIIQFILICWLAWPRIKQNIDNNRQGGWH